MRVGRSKPAKLDRSRPEGYFVRGVVRQVSADREKNNDLLGAALIRDDNMAVLKLLLGTPDKRFDDPQSSYARKLFDEHKNEESLHEWPRRCGMERRILHRLLK